MQKTQQKANVRYESANNRPQRTIDDDKHSNQAQIQNERHNGSRPSSANRQSKKTAPPKEESSESETLDQILQQMQLKNQLQSSKAYDKSSKQAWVEN
jgi:hypothetical protein